MKKVFNKKDEKIISLPCKFELNDYGSDLALVSLKICHSKLNLNWSYFELESFENSRDSFKNKWIVGEFDDEEEDFLGHTSNQKILGILDSDTLEITYDEDTDKHWIECKGYISKEYCGTEYEAIKEGRPVSMEVEIEEGFYEVDDILHVTKFNFLGVSVLGKTQQEAMKGANIEMFSKFSVNSLDSFAEKFSVMINEARDLVDKLQSTEGGNMMEEKDEVIVETPEVIEEVVEETEVEVVEEATEIEDEESAKFSLITKIQSIQECVFTHDEIYFDKFFQMEMKKYEYHDVTEDFTTVLLFDNSDFKIYGFDLTFDGDRAVIDFACKKKRYIYDLREFIEGEDLEGVEEKSVIDTYVKAEKDKFQKAIEEVKSSFDATQTEEYKTVLSELEEVKVAHTELSTEKATIEEENATLKVELEELKKFKAEIEKAEKESKVENVLEEFSACKEVDGYEDVIENRMEMSIEDLTKALKLFAFDNGITIKTAKKNTKKDFASERLGNVVGADVSTKEPKKYRSEIDRILETEY